MFPVDGSNGGSDTSPNTSHEQLNIPLVAWPPLPEPLAIMDRRTPLVIMGIGSVGYDVLHELSRRCGESRFDLKQQDMLKLVHIDLGLQGQQTRFDYVKRTEASTGITSFYLESVNDNFREMDGGAWAWISQFGLSYQNDITSRHWARTTFYKYLSTNIHAAHSAPIRAFLTHLYRDSEIILVGSALDIVGSNLLPDIAALIRYFQPQVTISAFSLLQEEPQQRNRLLADGDHQTATSIEFAYFSSGKAAYPELPLPPTFIQQPSSLFNRAYLVWGSKKQGGISNLVPFLWLSCLSDKPSSIANTIALPSSNDLSDQLAVNMLLSTEIRAPVTYLQNLYFHMVRRQVIDLGQDTHSNNYRRMSKSELRDLLRDLHTNLLLPVDVYNQVTQNQYPKLGQLSQWLRDLARESQKQIGQINDKLSPFWKNRIRSLTPAQLALGWEWSETGDFKMVFGQDGAPPIIDGAPFKIYEKYLNDYASRRSDMEVANILKREWGGVPQDDLENRWITDEVNTRYNGNDFKSAHINPNRDDALKNLDLIGLSQTLLVGQLKINQVRSVLRTNPILLQSLLTHQALGRVWRLFQADDNSGNLADFISIRPDFIAFVNDETIFRAFFWCFYTKQLPALFHEPNLIHPSGRYDYDALSWLERMTYFSQAWSRNDLIRGRLYQASFKVSLEELETLRFDDDDDDDFFAVIDANRSSDPTSEYLDLLLKRCQELVELPSRLDTSSVKTISFRTLFEIFVAWSTGAFSQQRTGWQLKRLNGFQKRLSESEELLLDGKQRYVTHLDSVEMLEGDETASALNRMFKLWHDRSFEHLQLPILWRWN